MCTSLAKLPFTTDPIEIDQLISKIWAVEGLQKQQERKKIFPFNWLYCKISICKSRLILLDCITHDVQNSTIYTIQPWGLVQRNIAKAIKLKVRPYRQEIRVCVLSEICFFHTQLATPFTIHTPLVKDFKQVFYWGAGVVYFRWISSLDMSACNPYILYGKVNPDVTQRVCGFQLNSQMNKGDPRTCTIFISAWGSNWGSSGFSCNQNNCDSSGAYATYIYSGLSVKINTYKMLNRAWKLWAHLFWHMWSAKTLRPPIWAPRLTRPLHGGGGV